MATSVTAKTQVVAHVRDRRWVLPWAGVTLAFLLFALYEAFIGAPTESTMGVYQRIFYVHLPAALAGWTGFALNFVASVIYLLRKSRKVDALALAGAEVGLVFLSINLISGPIWAKPIWGIWWTWDARLTLTLVMWVMYVSYLILRQLTPTSDLQPRLAAAVAIFIFADVPIDYMAIRWWRTQHPQPVLFGGQNSGLDPAMKFAVLISWIAFTLLLIVLLRLRYEQELDRHAIEDARRQYLLIAS
jgi:heme exporter protein C